MLFRLEIGGRVNLLIMMGADGSLSRQGSGEQDEFDTRLFMGSTDGTAFRELMDGINQPALQHPGSFNIQPIVGDKCLLAITFVGGSEKAVFEFVYGLESEGPPGEICEWVEKIVELTENWYLAQAIS